MNQKNFLRLTTSLLCVLACSSTVLNADQVTLKNGDRISGHIVKKDGANLTVKTDMMGEVTLPWSNVTDVKSDEPLFVNLPNGKQVSGKVTTEGGNLNVATSNAPATEPLDKIDAIRDAAEEQKYEKFLAPGLLDLWAGYADLGFSLARGNSHTDTLTTAFNAVRATNSDKTTLFLNQLYSTGTVGGNTGVTADSVRGGVSYDHTINGRWFWNVLNTEGYDTLQGLNFEFVLGGGLGYHAIKNTRTSLDLLVGADYTHEAFIFNITRNLAEFNFGDDFSHKLSGVTSVSQTLRYFIAPSNGQYRLAFNAGAATVIHKWLSWQISVNDNYLSAPVFGRKSNDIFLTTGLRATFAR